jgi:hypothetical protein
MNRQRIGAVVTLGIAICVLGGVAVTAEDEYTVQVSDGLAMSEFRGYESWQVVAISRTDELLNAIVANPAMIEAYQSGIPANGKPFPDGSKAAKIQWKPRRNPAAPFAVDVPDALKDVAFMAKDGKRFSESGGWGYGVFDYDPELDRFTPDGTGSACGFACHSDVKGRDFVFTDFAKR